MDINRHNLETVFRNLRKDFNGGLDTRMPVDISAFADVIPMTSATLRFDFLGDDPEFREWVGPRKAHEYASQEYTVDYADWELTIRMKRRDLRDDNIGLYSLKAKNGGQAAARLKPREVHKAIEDGASRACYDGQNFFDTDHPVGEDGDITLVSNFIGGGASAGSGAGDGGSTASPWYLIDPTRVVKPFLWLNREDPSFEAFDDYSNLHTFMLNEFLFGGQAYGKAHYGLWQTAFRCDDTMTVNKIREVHNAMIALTGNKKHEDGKRRRLGITPLMLLVGEGNRERADVLMNQVQIHSYTADPLVPGAADTLKPNLVYKRYQVVSSPWLP